MKVLDKRNDLFMLCLFILVEKVGIGETICVVMGVPDVILIGGKTPLDGFEEVPLSTTATTARQLDRHDVEVIEKGSCSSICNKIIGLCESVTGTNRGTSN